MRTPRCPRTEVELLISFGVWLGITVVSLLLRFHLVVRWQRFPQVMPRGEAIATRPLLLLHFGPHQEATVEAEVEEFAGSESQRLLCQQSAEAGRPPVKHCLSHFGAGVGGAPENLRGKDLKSTEVQNPALKRDAREKCERLRWVNECPTLIGWHPCCPLVATDYWSCTVMKPVPRNHCVQYHPLPAI